MPPEAADRAYLWDIERYALQAQGLVANCSFEQFRDDMEKRLAVERCLGIIGEAAGKVSKEFRSAHPEIPWNPLIRLRNVLM